MNWVRTQQKQFMNWTSVSDAITELEQGSKFILDRDSDYSVVPGIIVTFEAKESHDLDEGGCSTEYVLSAEERELLLNKLRDGIAKVLPKHLAEGW